MIMQVVVGLVTGLLLWAGGYEAASGGAGYVPVAKDCGGYWYK